MEVCRFVHFFHPKGRGDIGVTSLVTSSAGWKKAVLAAFSGQKRKLIGDVASWTDECQNPSRCNKIRLGNV